ncbi:hypothetical protein [Clostridium sp.]|uniref:hypothetical protein n=1 Tax=Clostridium sp. TaxID=1506 RepID=UPI0032168A2B
MVAKNAFILTEAMENKWIEGKKEGKKEGKVEIAYNMKRKGLTIDMIIDLTGLSKEEIENL